MARRLDPITAIVDGLDAAGVQTVAYLPCGQIRGLFPRLDGHDRIRTYRVTREEEGVGLLAGTALAGTRCALVMQSSGLGNSLNALTTLTEVYELPLTLIVSHRGYPGDFNPAQVPQGRRTRDWLKSIDAATRIPHTGEVRDAVRDAADQAWDERRITAVLLEHALFGEGDPE